MYKIHSEITSGAVNGLNGILRLSYFDVIFGERALKRGPKLVAM